VKSGDLGVRLLGPSVLEQLADALLDLKSETLPLEVQAKACLCVADALASALDGIDEKQAARARGVITLGAGCVIWGTGHRARVQDAAFANAIATHALIEDDIYRLGSIHPAGTVIPAAIATAEMVRSSGRDLLRAVVLGYEVIGRISSLLLRSESFMARAFRPTSLFAPFGAAAAAGILLNLEPRQLAGALGLAGNLSGGLRQWGAEGTYDPYVAVGSGVRNGITAAEFAGADLGGSLRLLEAEHGFIHAYGNDEVDPAQLLRGIGQEYVLTNVTFKAAPSARFVQPAMQLTQRLKADKALVAEAVDRITVYTSQHNKTIPGADYRGPFENAIQARMSYQFTVAAVLLYGRASQAEFRSFDDPRVAALAKRIDVVMDPALDAEFERTLATGVRIIVKRMNGTEVEGQQEDLIPLTADQVFNKLRVAASQRFRTDRAVSLCAHVQQLASLEDVTRLTDRLSVS
jgi:2-methylcitrate dehydratase PrpD